MADLISLPVLARSWQLGEVVDSAWPGNLLPSGVGFNAARADREDFVESVSALAVRGLDLKPVETVRVPKSDGSTRPAADLPATDQMIYECLARHIRTELYQGLVTFTSGVDSGSGYHMFEDFPLTVRNAAYVLMADAAAFYEYVDYDRLGYELVGTTGDADTAEALVQMLAAWMGDAGGLPQGPSGSAPLADIYISPVARLLARAGYQFRRYSDDFRIVARNWTEARRAQLDLERAMREVGLVVSPGKLWTPKIDRYRADVLRVREQREVTPPLIEEEEVGEGPYDPETVIHYVVTPEERERAENVVRQVPLATPTDISTRRIDVTRTRLVRWALARLAYSGSEAGLNHFPILMRRYAHIVQSLSSYLKILLSAYGSDRAGDVAIQWLDQERFRYDWQVGWILHALCYSSKQDRRAARIASRLLVDGGTAWMVRGQAALCLARHGSLPSQSEFARIYELSPDSSRTELVAAVVIAQPRWRRDFLEGVAATPLLRAVTRLDPEDYQGWLR